MFVICTAILVALFRSVLTHSTSPGPDTIRLLPLPKGCEKGSIVENECNKCTCSSNNVFQCISKPCNQTTPSTRTNNLACEPNTLYIKNVTACLCGEDGSWPHDICKTEFNIFQENPKTFCDPNTYAVIDCNVCKCNPDGTINKTRCTKNKCQNESKKSRRHLHNQVYGSCESQNWYSFAPCQFCYCVTSNKLICNKGNKDTKKLQLGTYDLTICGPDLFKEADSLIAGKDPALRLGMNMTSDNTDNTEPSETYQPYRELNLEENGLPLPQNDEKNTNDSGESDMDIDDKPKARMSIDRNVASTKLPYVDDENNSSSETENERQIPAQVSETPKVNVEPAANVLRVIPKPPAYPARDYSQQFEWNAPAPDNSKDKETHSLNLGDVLKPFLPSVLDKVLKFALRKSMVSVVPNSNCIPGSTTLSKCNSCFCLKNKKLICTTNACK